MGKVLKDSQGNILLANGGAIEITSAIDPNIQAGNIKKGVNILGVTGTYEGSGGGSGSGYPATTFYTGSSSIPGAKGAKAGGGSGPTPSEPGTNITFYVSYPSVNDKVPDMFIVYDINKAFTKNISYAILSTSQTLSDIYYNGNVGMSISITSLTSTMATLQYNNGNPDPASFDPTQFQFAPIYLS